jgi:hypothetical protein
MPLFTRTFQIIAGVLTIPIVGTAVIGVNYASPFLTHLVDIVNGSQTITDIETNAPNWGYAVQLPQVQGVSSATTTSGTLASSTAYTFAVSALDQTGTTTVSAVSTTVTDPASSLLGAESIEVTWAPVAGAQGYAVRFATGTVSTASALTQYFLASSSSAYLFSTSTGSLSGSYTKSDTTAFADILQPNGPSYIEGDNGTATGSPVAASGTALEINGGLRVTEPATTTSCDSQTVGTIFYNTSNSHEWGCSSTGWVKIY